MIEWNSDSTSEKIIKWKEFREAEYVDLNSFLNQLVKFFKNAPLKNKTTINIYNPKEWPTPWEIIDNNVLDVNLVSILMFYTICFSYPNEDVYLNIVEQGFDKYLIVRIGNILLNYFPNEITDIGDDVQLFVKEYSKTQIIKK
jgi:hypothetical protein